MYVSSMHATLLGLLTCYQFIFCRHMTTFQMTRSCVCLWQSRPLDAQCSDNQIIGTTLSLRSVFLTTFHVRKGG